MDVVLGVFIELCASILVSDGFLFNPLDVVIQGLSHENGCGGLTCGDHGSCHTSGLLWHTVHSCICHLGWTGRECDQAFAARCGDLHCVHGDCIEERLFLWDSHTCRCHQGYYGTECDQPVTKSALTKPATTSTTTKTTTPAVTTPTPQATTTTTKTPPSTTAPPLTTSSSAASPVSTSWVATSTQVVTTTAKIEHQYKCHTLAVITDLANNVTSTDVNAAKCQSGEAAKSEAFVMDHCNVGMPSSWTKGQKVMSVCSTLQTYTPIATFSVARFDPQVDTAGLFLGCLGDQIRIGLQTCDGGTRIEHFSVTGSGIQDANLYYTIQ